MSKNLLKLAGTIILVLLCAWWIDQGGLKPGIDLAGGTSLLYEIDTTGMSSAQAREASQQMIRVLKERVDPDNRMNLVWRPQGSNRIEIQMPLASESTREKRQAYQALRDEIAARNLPRRLVDHGLARTAAETTDAAYEAGRLSRFEALAEVEAGTDPATNDRLKRLVEIGAAYDEVMAAKEVLGAGLEAHTKVSDAIETAEMNLTRVDMVALEWATMSDPCQAAAVVDLAGDDVVKQTLVTTYVEARQGLARARAALDIADIALDGAYDDLDEANVDLRRLGKFLEKYGTTRDDYIRELESAHPDLAAAGTLKKLVAAYDAYVPYAGRLDDPEDLKRKLRGSGVLEFRILPREPRFGGESLNDAEILHYRELLAKYGPDSDKTRGLDYVWAKIRDIDAWKAGGIVGEFADEMYVLSSNQPEETLLRGVDGWKLADSRRTTDQYGRPAIGFSFNATGAKYFWDLTRNNKNRPLCILLDGQALSAPNIRSAIGKDGVIEGEFTDQEINDQIDKLNAGSLPARLGDEPISVNSVSATLGTENLQQGLRAGIIGLVVVAVFMLIYYIRAGLLADIALCMNMLIILGVMSFSQSTFTMPGIAGLILTIGMAVDANVLIFEALREVQGRYQSLSMMVKAGYDQARKVILNANLTTFIVALILWLFASEEVKGFALTLMIGLVTSVFTALFVTRMIFDLLIERRIWKERIGMLRLFKQTPTINWIGMRKGFFALSILLVIGSWTVFYSRNTMRDENSPYSIEFTGGSSVRVVLNEDAGDLDREGIENLLRDKLTGLQVQQLGDASRREYEIITTDTNRLKVHLTLPAAMGFDAASLQEQIQTEAKAHGDARLQRATVTSAEANVFVLETTQSSRTRVREVIDAVLQPTMTTQTSGDDCVVTVAAGWLTPEQLQERLPVTARARSVAGMDKATVTSAGEGQLKVTCAAKKKAAEAVIAAAVLEGVSPKLDDFETERVVADAIDTAIGDKLKKQRNLAPTITAVAIDDDLMETKPYVSKRLRGGTLLTVTFGGNATETMTNVEKRLTTFTGKDESMLQFGPKNNYEVYGPGQAMMDAAAVVQGVEIAVASAQTGYEADMTGEERALWDAFVANEQVRFTAALSEEGALPGVMQIDASVGRESMGAALRAMIFSLIAIIIYITIEFGNVRYGFAAVAALAHDVSVALGLVALSAWLSTTALGKALLIGDFKIDLPMIAGFLTVVGYSINDTIVVFHRTKMGRTVMEFRRQVREHRRFVMSADILNESINQVLSRTVLTSVTTLIVLVVMYIWGGAALRGFNFVLIIGVLVGTYSSIGIAVPLLFGATIGGRKEETTATTQA